MKKGEYQSSKHVKRIDRLIPYLFISPFYITFIIFMVWPILSAFYLSFTNWMGSDEYKFIGLQNYIRLFGDTQFHLSLYNTFYLAFVSLIIMIPLSLISASVLNTQWLKFKGVFRLLFFAPIATTPVAIALVFVGLYDTDYGVINYILNVFNIPRINWLGSAQWIKTSILIVVLWRSTGLYMIYFLAGLQTIPNDLYEASTVDGANAVQKFFQITLPLLRPMILFVMVIATIDILQLFDESVMLNKFSHASSTSAGPEDAGLTIAFLLYRQGFSYFNLSYGSAIGIIIFLIVFSLSMLQMKAFGFSSTE
jgi:ABC-type sugar transport system permease subunit